MVSLIAQHRRQIEELCRRHNVKRLDLFGSAARGDFQAEKSDLDFFVEFLSYDSPSIADNWFGLQEDLESLFARKVDLASVRAPANPRFLEMANRYKVTLYAA